jgi:hypothetical protein
MQPSEPHVAEPDVEVPHAIADIGERNARSQPDVPRPDHRHVRFMRDSPDAPRVARDALLSCCAAV